MLLAPSCCKLLGDMRIFMFARHIRYQWPKINGPAVGIFEMSWISSKQEIISMETAHHSSRCSLMDVSCSFGVVCHRSKCREVLLFSSKLCYNLHVEKGKENQNESGGAET
mmetsp:Transcript_12426/g.20670  ORF Transcript_12426/g.20670 Transcript_12426/m.20670 type:complete len:111 (-) Transcript_12426:223-555(-)